MAEAKPRLQHQKSGVLLTTHGSINATIATFIGAVPARLKLKIASAGRVSEKIEEAIMRPVDVYQAKKLIREEWEAPK